MDHIGIDLGSVKSHLVTLSSTGEVLRREEIATKSLPRFLSLLERSRVVMEACTQSRVIARSARLRHDTKVVPGQVVRLLGVGARGIKTDDRDAEALARASLLNPNLPDVHVRSDESRQRRELISSRAQFVKMRSQLGTRIKSWLRGELITVRGRANRASFASSVRSLPLFQKDGVPDHVEAELVTFEHLCRQVALLDEQLASVVETDEDCQRLMTVPGVGPVVAVAFAAHIDDASRFRDGDALASYLALVPGEATTGGKIVRTGTIKVGPKHLKALLVQSAWSMYRARPHDPLCLWAKRIAEKRNNRVAIIALARKLATILWAMQKTKTNYDPSRASSFRNEVAERTMP